MAATFITGAIGGTLMALRSSLPFGIGGPEGASSAVTAALGATLARPDGVADAGSACRHPW